MWLNVVITEWEQQDQLLLSWIQLSLATFLLAFLVLFIPRRSERRFITTSILIWMLKLVTFALSSETWRKVLATYQIYSLSLFHPMLLNIRLHIPLKFLQSLDQYCLIIFIHNLAVIVAKVLTREEDPLFHAKSVLGLVMMHFHAIINTILHSLQNPLQYAYNERSH